MGKLLDTAIAEAEIDDDRRWDELFSRPSGTIDRLADAALAEHRAGRTTPLHPEKP